MYGWAFVSVDAVEESGGRVEGSGIQRALDRLADLVCHLQAKMLYFELVLAGAFEATGSFLQSASARGDILFGKLLQQLHVNGILSVGSYSWAWVWVWNLSYVWTMSWLVGGMVGVWWMMLACI